MLSGTGSTDRRCPGHFDTSLLSRCDFRVGCLSCSDVSTIWVKIGILSDHLNVNAKL